LVESTGGKDYRSVVTIRRPRDLFFAVFYFVALFAMVVSGIIVRASSRVCILKKNNELNKQ